MTVEWPITRYAVRYRRAGEDAGKPWIVLKGYDRPGEAIALKILVEKQGGQDVHIVSYQQSEYVRYETG